MTNAVKNHFGDSLDLSSPSIASILNFRKSILQNSNDIDDKDIKEFAESIKIETGRTDRTLCKMQFIPTLYKRDAVTH